MPSHDQTAPTRDTVTGQLTFLEHIQELRARLSWVVIFLLLTSSAGYAIKDQIIGVLMKPLGSQHLYYLTPVGGLSFLIKICFYFGILASVPVIVYQLYRYLQPLMPGKSQSTFWYVVWATVLAASGVTFAYFVSLPAALHFLTDFNLANITAMLTVDAYLTFVTSYLLGAALLFQIPLVLLIINTITPLKPGGLMKYQRHVVLAAFIVAAVISPTPDIFNQTILALPIVVMYQIGILLVWLSNRKRTQDGVAAAPVPAIALPVRPAPIVVVPAPQPMTRKGAPSRAVISDFGPRKITTRSTARPLSPVRRPTPTSRAVPIARRSFGSIDGMIPGSATVSKVA